MINSFLQWVTALDYYKSVEGHSLVYLPVHSRAHKGTLSMAFMT